MPSPKPLTFFDIRSREMGLNFMTLPLYQEALRKYVGKHFPINLNLEQILHHYKLYFEYLLNLIKQQNVLQIKDLYYFICDSSLGDGDFKAALLLELLRKDGALEACLYINSYDQSILSILAEAGDTYCYNIIITKLANHPNNLDFLLSLADDRGYTPQNYLDNEISEESYETGDLESIIEFDDAILLKDFFNSNIVRSRQAILEYLKTSYPHILHHIAAHGSISCLNMLSNLLHNDIKLLNTLNDQHFSPLHVALCSDNLSIIVELCKVFSISIEDEFTANNNTLFDKIIHSNNLEIITYIFSFSNLTTAFIKYYSEKESINSDYFLPSGSKAHNPAAFFVLSTMLYPNFYLNEQFVTAYEEKKDNLSFIMRLAIENYDNKYGITEPQPLNF